MLDEPYRSHYSAFVIALPIAIFIQNAFLSVFHLTKHHNYVSTILKTLFNLSGAGRLLVSFIVIMLPIITTKQCSDMMFVHSILSMLYRESLVAFLLWRLIHITNSIWDKHIALILLLTRTGLQLFHVIKDQLETRPTTEFCNVLAHRELSTVMFVVTDYLIDLYITVRLVQILGSANRKFSRSVSVPRDSKRTLFTAVLWWNFLRVFVATLVDSLALYNAISKKFDPVLFNTLQAIVCIAMSYVLTFDADIVKTIQGKTTTYGGNRHEAGSRVGHTSVSEVTVVNETQPEILQGRIKGDDLERNGNRTNVGSGAWLPPIL